MQVASFVPRNDVLIKSKTVYRNKINQELLFLRKYI